MSEFNFLKSNELFNELTEEEFELLVPLMNFERYKKGAVVFREGERGKTLYIISTGKVEITKKRGEEIHRLATLKKGDWFGEMALLGDEKRSATVSVLEDTEAVTLSLDNLDEWAKKNTGYNKILTILAKNISHHLGTANEAVINSLDHELKLTKIHDQMGRLIIYLFILMTFYFYTFKAYERFGSDTTINRVIISGLIVCYGIVAVFLVMQSGYPLSFYGLTLKNWRRNIWEAFWFTIPILILMFLAKWVLITFVPHFKDLSLFMIIPTPEHSFFSFLRAHKENIVESHFVFIILYILLVPVQEFIARGCLQGCLQNFFRMSYKTFWAIFISNLLFGVFHGLETFSFVLITFILGMFWGWLYARQKSIIGPVISHILIGIWAFAFLNAKSVLTY